MGDTKSGAFDVSGDLAREWLRLPANPNGRPNSDVLRPWVNGMDLTRRPAGKWIVDFGWNISEADAALYEEPFRHVKEHVWPMRQRNRRESYRLNWWRHVEPRQGMWEALDGLRRFIVTPTVSKHRLFVWLDAGVCPDHQLIVIAHDDDLTFGILHSRFHEAWSLRLGTSLEDRPRYTPTTTFETFPFSDGLSPDIRAADYSDAPRAMAIAEAARRLVELRDRWLNPPEWVEWVEEPMPGYPKRPGARDEAAAKKLKARTLTNLYNARPQWLADAHVALDAAVAAAYGWDAEISQGRRAVRVIGDEPVRRSCVFVPCVADPVVALSGYDPPGPLRRTRPQSPGTELWLTDSLPLHRIAHERSILVMTVPLILHRQRWQADTVDDQEIQALAIYGAKREIAGFFRS